MPASASSMSSVSAAARRVRTKRRNQANKENVATTNKDDLPQRKDRAQPSSHLQQSPLDMVGEATPMPQERPLLEVTPELCLPPPRISCTSSAAEKMVKPMASLGLPPVATFEADCEPLVTSRAVVSELDEVCQATKLAGLDASPVETASEAAQAVRGLDALAPIQLWQGEMPVKDTFIHFKTISPATQKTTKLLSGDTEPKNWKPQPFQELAASVEEDPVVISLQQSLAPSAPKSSSNGGRRIQLNLSVWIPPAERPQRVCLAEHLSPRGASQSATAATIQGASSSTDANGDPVRRRLFESGTI